MNVINFILAILAILLFVFIIIYYLMENNEDAKDKTITNKLKHICEEYKLYNYYECSSMARYILIIFSILLALGLFLYLIISSILIWESIYAIVLLCIVIVCTFNNGTHILKIENDILKVKKGFKERRYEIKSIKNITYSRSFIYRKKMALYIRESIDEESARYGISLHKFDDVEILVYLIHFIKTESLSSITNISTEDIKKLRKIYKFDT